MVPDSLGNWSIDSLPPIIYNISAYHPNPDITFDADTISLVDRNRTKEFIYYAPLEVIFVDGSTSVMDDDDGLSGVNLSDFPDFLDADNYIYPFLNCIKGTATQNCIEGSSQVQGSFYHNEKINQLITQQRKTLNSTEREEIFVKIQKILAEDVPYIPLWQTKEYAFIQNDINGTIFNLNQTFPFWKITRSKIEKVVK